MMMIIILKNCFYPPGRNYIILLSYMSRCFVCVRACECQRERERERERDRGILGASTSNVITVT